MKLPKSLVVAVAMGCFSVAALMDRAPAFAQQSVDEISFDSVPDYFKYAAEMNLGTMAPGAPWTICITPGPTQYLYTNDAFPGRIYKLTLDGNVVGMLGKAGRAAQTVQLGS